MFRIFRGHPPPHVSRFTLHFRGLNFGMKIESLSVGMDVRHPQYGVGTVKTVSETTAEIQFNDGKRTISPEAAGIEAAVPQLHVSGLGVPLKQFVEETLDTA